VVDSSSSDEDGGNGGAVLVCCAMHSGMRLTPIPWILACVCGTELVCCPLLPRPLVLCEVIRAVTEFMASIRCASASAYGWSMTM
jgi:hypothetical protein